MLEIRACKFVIIGGGPAGTQCALTLHRWGLNVTVISRPLSHCPSAQIPLLNDKNRSTVEIARENIIEFRNRNIRTVTGSARAIKIIPRTGFQVTVDDGTVDATHVILATGSPRADGTLDLSELEELEFDSEGRIINSSDYETGQCGLFAIGEAAADYVRTLSCALGTGDGVARMLAKRHWKQPHAA